MPYQALSPAQYTALTQLHRSGGEGVIDKHGRLVAQGERLTGIDPITWLRLITTGHVEVRGPLRIGLTVLGGEEAVPPSRKVHQDLIRGDSFQSSARQPGAE